MSRKLYFENNQGKVEMFLGGAGPVRVTALSGLGNPEKKYNTVEFAGKGGQKTLSWVEKPRTILIGGDIKVDDRSRTEQILTVLHEPGTLYLEFDDKKRKIYCSQVDFSDGERKGSYMKFALTLTADQVFFTDVEQTHQGISGRKDLLEGDIVFPCMFTIKTTGATAVNSGETNVEPVISIYNTFDEDKEETGEIVVENKTTGQMIKLVTGTVLNEEITIDITNRKVISSVRGTITHLISDDTYLNKFWLVPGYNYLTFNHNNEGEQLSVVCSYYNNYREGIY